MSMLNVHKSVNELKFHRSSGMAFILRSWPWYISRTALSMCKSWEDLRQVAWR